MNALKTQWLAWNARFTALTRREKLIISAVAVLGPGFLGFNFGVEPLMLKAKAASRLTAQTREEMQMLQTQLSLLGANANDPDKANRARLDRLQAQIKQASERLTRFEAGMVPPERMQDFLQGLLSKNRNLELVALETLPVSIVGAKMGKAADKAAEKKVELEKEALAVPVQGIYQHGLELKVAGSYNDLLDYLTELERLPQHVMWNSVSLIVDKYPRSIMTLKVYTLSLDPDWLVVS